MAQNDKVGRGSLGQSQRQNGPNSPTHIGSITLDGPVAAGEKLWLAAWLKQDESGRRYLSIVIERPQERQRNAGAPRGQYTGAPQQQSFGAPRPQAYRAPTQSVGQQMDDEIPF